MAILTDIFRLEQRGRAIGYSQMAIGASQILGIPIRLFLANRWSWQITFLMIVLIAFFVWLLIVFVMKLFNMHLSVKNPDDTHKHFCHTLSKSIYVHGFSALVCYV